jgi:hypothetical protein
MAALAKIEEHESGEVVSLGETSTMQSMLNRMMTDPSVSIERVEQAFSFYQKVQANDARRAFDEAMALAKAEIQPITKNRSVSFDMKGGGTKRYKHEDLAGIAQAVDPILAKHGLSYRFRTTSVLNEPVSVTCIVSHRLGYSEENTLHAGRDDSGNKNSIQAIGSTITYLQRYTLKAALGLAAAHDDDGKKADATDAFITDEQVAELTALIQETGIDYNKFLEIGKVESLSDLLANDFDAAKKLLLSKKQKGTSK